MPGYKAHISFGFLLYSIVFLMLYHYYSLSPLCFLELACCTILGALFPDIDIKSKGQKYIYNILFIIGLPLLCMQYYMLVAFVGWIFFIPMIVKHRGVFHDPLLMNIVVVCMWWMVYIYFPIAAKRCVLHFFCFGVGMNSHIILDYGIIVFFKKLSKKRNKKKFMY